MTDRYLDSKKHEPPTGVILEGLWRLSPETNHNGLPVRGWARHDTWKCSAGHWHLVCPEYILAPPPEFWRLQQDLPPLPFDG
jgi:hypothetical protein